MPDRGGAVARSPHPSLLARLPRHDRGQLERGLTACLKAAYMQRQFGRVETPVEERAAVYAKLTIDQRYLGFKKAYAPPATSRKAHKNEFQVTNAYITTPAIKGRFGFPLGKFPATKCVQKPKVDANQVDYSVDEMDIDWMETVNAHRHKLGRTILSIPEFEFWLDRLEKFCLFKPKEHSKLKGEDGEELDDVCNVCLDGDTSNSNQIVYCDMCNIAMHQDCYGIPFLPEGSLVCRRCAVSPGKPVSCELCPCKNGAVKQLPNGKWVHVICVLWVEETHFGNTIFMEHVQNVEKALHDRRALSCQLCKNRVDAKMGACIQCSETKCTASFHVTCARNAGLVMRVSETEDGNVHRWVWCMKHTPPETDADREQKQLMIRNARRENERKLPAISFSMPTITSAKIAEIVATHPIDDHREIVLYWFQKRKNRLGAPLLKKMSEPNDKDSVVPRRRLSRNNTTELNRSLMKKNVQSLSLESARTLFELTDRREEKKKDYVNASTRLFVSGFKPPECLQMEVIEAITKKDEQKVFAEPVDIPGYLDEIKNPICLKTMNEKANTGKYANMKELAADIALMFDNCAQFNRGNKWFIDYGKKIRRQSAPIVEAAITEEESRRELHRDEAFMLQLVNTTMSEYSGWSKRAPVAPAKVEEDRDEVLVVDNTPPGPTPRRKRRKSSSCAQKMSSVVKIEEIDDDTEDEPPAPPGPSTTPRRPKSRRRGNDHKDDDEDQKPSTSSGKSGNGSSKSRGHNKSEEVTESQLFSPNSLRKRAQTTESSDVPQKAIRKEPTQPSSIKQTKMTNFFAAIPKSQQLSFNNVPNAAPRPLFDTPTTKSTRSSSRLSSSITGKSEFRVSSATLQSPLPAPRGGRMDDTDDSQDELELVPPKLDAEQIEAQKLKCAENEAQCKFAHNQLVVVDGRAGKVVWFTLAHLSNMHVEQRQVMMKKRREILREITDPPLILVEFFQKPAANLDWNGKWVPPEAIELLDVNNVQNSPKILGLKAAREWHRKVLNGDI